MSISAASISGSVVGSGVIGVDLVQVISGGGVITSFTYKLTELGGMRCLELSVVCTGTTDSLIIEVPRSTAFGANNLFVIGGCNRDGGADIEAVVGEKQIEVAFTAGPTSVNVSVLYPYA